MLCKGFLGVSYRFLGRADRLSRDVAVMRQVSSPIRPAFQLVIR